MIDSAVVHEDAWPALAESKPDDEDWEMLRQETAASPNNTAFEIVVDEAEVESKVKSTAPNPRNLRHCVSSPDFSSINAPLLDAVAEGEELDAFSLISGPASVMTASTGMMVSFRDAMLATPGKDVEPAKSQLSSTLPLTRKQRSRIQPRFVVVASPPPTAIRRCFKSTGDLKSLVPATMDEHDDDKNSGDGSSGVCDTVEFYNRKALGSASRSNGLKLRPDEAKRRDMILFKKELQRQKAKTSSK